LKVYWKFSEVRPETIENVSEFPEPVPSARVTDPPVKYALVSDPSAATPNVRSTRAESPALIVVGSTVNDSTYTDAEAGAARLNRAMHAMRPNNFVFMT
jgi:hypothetical protein